MVDTANDTAADKARYPTRITFVDIEETDNTLGALREMEYPRIENLERSGRAHLEHRQDGAALEETTLVIRISRGQICLTFKNAKDEVVAENRFEASLLLAPIRNYAGAVAAYNKAIVTPGADTNSLNAARTAAHDFGRDQFLALVAKDNNIRLQPATAREIFYLLANRLG